MTFTRKVQDLWVVSHLGQIGCSEEWNKWLVISFQGKPESKDVLFKGFACPGSGERFFLDDRIVSFSITEGSGDVTDGTALPVILCLKINDLSPVDAFVAMTDDWGCNVQAFQVRQASF